MRFRAGLIIGFGIGYYLGAMAGRERYEQINRMLQRARQSDAFETASQRAREAVEPLKEKARDLTGQDLDPDQLHSAASN